MVNYYIFRTKHAQMNRVKNLLKSIDKPSLNLYFGKFLNYKIMYNNNYVFYKGHFLLKFNFKYWLGNLHLGTYIQM